jgi:nicotinamidase/pyrazinamidase
MNTQRTALIVVDIQNDFLSGGALAVRNGDQVVPIANRLIASGEFDVVVATQDWHPSNHKSFAANHAGAVPGDVIDLNHLQQVLWPVHCVQNTRGADFAAGLQMAGVDKIIRKGSNPNIDSYSGFFDNGHRRATGLAEYLEANAVSDLYVLGLATDYCVKFTALDGVRLGFNVHLIEDGCRGVELIRGDVEKAILAMRDAGVEILQSEQVYLQRI